MGYQRTRQMIYVAVPVVIGVVLLALAPAKQAPMDQVTPNA
jgi:hypothetical protein